MPDLNKQIAQLVRRSHATQLEMLKTTETKLLALYRDAANDIGNMILSAEGSSIERLKSLMGDLEARVHELNRRGDILVQQHVTASVRVGVRAQDSAVRLSLPSGLRTLVPGSAFGQVYHDAVLAMTTTPSGIQLSGQIWNANMASLRGMRDIMLRSMLGGQTASDTYRMIKAQLLLPNVDMRTRFWRQYFIENPPGRGVYRSAWKNVQRVLRTESNRAFRQAAAVYARSKPWAKGVKWNLSAAHPEFDICCGGWERVQTDREETPIADVQIGDRVLTHQGRYRPVLRTMSRTIRDGQIAVIAFRTEQGSIRTLIVTPNHPVLSADGWISAGQLRQGMLIASPRAEHDEVAHQQKHDACDKALQGFAGSGPCQGTGNGAEARCDACPPWLRRWCSQNRGVSGTIEQRSCSIGSSRFRGNLLANWDSQNRGAFLRGVCEKQPVARTCQNDEGQSSGWPSRESDDMRANNGSELPEDREGRRKTFRMLDSFAGRQHALSDSMPENRSAESYPMLLLERTAHILDIRECEKWSELERRTCGYKTVVLYDEKDVRAWEAAVLRSVRMFGSHIHHSMDTGKWQQVEDIRMAIVGTMRVYNLEIAEDNSYVIGGAIVHNCDELASQDNGMGPGVYYPSEVPDSGHSHCLCYLTTVVDERYFETAEMAIA